MPTRQLALILASASPRRRELLSVLGLQFQVVPADTDESKRHGEDPQDYVRRLAAAKARTVARKFPDHHVLGADTVVVIDGTSLGKPADAGQAAAMIRRLSGRTHRVHSGVALVRPGHDADSLVSTSEVSFAALPESWISHYAASGEPLDKAGAYGIQGRAAALISRLEGSYSGVVGLPLFETAKLLRNAGIAL